MKKFLLSLLCLLAVAASAVAETKTYVFDFINFDYGMPRQTTGTNYLGTGTIASNDASYKTTESSDLGDGLIAINYAKSAGNIRLWNTSGLRVQKNTTATFTLEASGDAKITAVKATNAKAVNCAIGENLTLTSTSTSSTASLSWNGSATTVVLLYKTGSSTCDIEKIEVTYDVPSSGPVDPVITFTPNPVVTPTGEAALPTITPSGLSFDFTEGNITCTTESGEATDYILVEESGITVVTEGTYIVTAKFPASEKYNAAEASFKVVYAQPKKQFTEFTIPSITDLTTKTGIVAPVIKGEDGNDIEATITWESTPAGVSFEGYSFTLPDFGSYTVKATANAEGYDPKDCTFTLTATDPSVLVDVITLSTFPNAGSYTSVVAGVGSKTGIDYKGAMIKNNGNMQMNAGKSGIVVVDNKGYVAKEVKITWASNTTNNRTLTLYGNENAYTESGALSGVSGSVELKKFTKTSSPLTETYTLEKNYPYIGFYAGSAVYVESIEITWVPGKPSAGLAFDKESCDAVIGKGIIGDKPVLTNTNNVEVSYTSSNPEFATVDPTTGEVTPVAEGTTVITATFAGNDEFAAGKASYTLNVSDGKAPAGLAFDKTSYTLYRGDAAPVLGNPNNLKVTYTSSDESVAAIVDGEVKILEAGTTTITASTDGNDDYKAATVSYTLTVKDAALSIQEMRAKAGVKGQTVYVNFPLIVTACMKREFSASAKPDTHVYLKDEAGDVTYLYFKGSDYTGTVYQYETGAQIPGGWTAKNDEYNKLREWVTSDQLKEALPDKKEVTYEEVETITLEDMNKVVKLKHVLVAVPTDVTTVATGVLKDGTEVRIRNRFNLPVEEKGIYDIVGAVSRDYDELRFLPIQKPEKVAELAVINDGFQNGNLKAYHVQSKYADAMGETTNSEASYATTFSKNANAHGGKYVISLGESIFKTASNHQYYDMAIAMDEAYPVKRCSELEASCQAHHSGAYTDPAAEFDYQNFVLTIDNISVAGKYVITFTRKAAAADKVEPETLTVPFELTPTLEDNVISFFVKDGANEHLAGAKGESGWELYSKAYVDENRQETTDISGMLDRTYVRIGHIGNLYYRYDDSSSNEAPEMMALAEGEAELGYQKYDGTGLNLKDNKALSFYAVVNGAKSATKSISFDSKDVPTAVEGVAAEDGEAEYYTLEGIRVNVPLQPGVYVARKGGNAHVIYVK